MSKTPRLRIARHHENEGTERQTGNNMRGTGGKGEEKEGKGKDECIDPKNFRSWI